MWSFGLDTANQNDKYGLVITLIAIFTRMFVVTIAWSYGVFLVALKSTFPTAHFSELGWIAGLAQGLGSILAPLFNFISVKFGVTKTFILGFILCFLSLFTSSFVTSEHYLFVTYSLPYGIGSAIIFVLGSVCTGLYFPPGNRYHIAASVAIGLGFPLGYLVLNPLSNMLLEYFNNWQTVQRIYSGIVFVCMLVCCPLFTDKHASGHHSGKEVQPNYTTKVFDKEIASLSPNQVRILVRLLWFNGILMTSCANNSILIHLNGYFGSIGLNHAAAISAFITLGIADACYRILLAVFGNYLRNNLSLCYIASSLIGIILSILWSSETTQPQNIIYCILFGFCPATTMSLMYSINTELAGPANINKNYTLNVMFSGIGLILGPIISGVLLDSSKNNYELVFVMATIFYVMSFISFGVMKIFLAINDKDKPVFQLGSEYVEFENDAQTSFE